MKSSVGVTICAVVVLIGSALALLGTAGAAFMLLGPLKGQLLDPANLPPGADLNMMRGMLVSALFMGGAFGAVGVATGIGLIRLWKWARYAAIAMGVVVIAFSALPAVFMAFAPIPPPSSDPNGPVPVGFRMLLVGFYLVWAVLGGIFVYVMLRKSTAAQFNGGETIVAAPRARPLSVTIIAWLMIAGAIMSLPMFAWANLPAVFIGLVMTGLAAKFFYVSYMVANVAIGTGLLRNTRASLLPAVTLHSLALLNSMSLLIPSVWTKYNETMTSVSPMFAQQPGAQSSQYYGVLFGVAYAGLMVLLLLRARRTLSAAAEQ